MLRVEGAVRNPRVFRFEDLAALPDQIEDVSSVVPGKEAGAGGAVKLAALLEVVKAEEGEEGAAFATLASGDGRFAICVPLAAIADAVIAYRIGAGPLPESKGGPARFYIAKVREGVDACANVKQLGTIRLTKSREPDVGHSH